MVDVRTAILKAKRAATRLHRDFQIRDRIEKQDSGRVDVFGTILEKNLPLLFKPLDGLLGVYIDDPIPGVMVTTKRPLSVQRFTGAHELGHYTLGHLPSLDDETVLRRSPFAAAPDYEQQEMEANAFATEFMLPPWLFATHFTRQGWNGSMMADPKIVYQLSLRLGASYEATCRSLVRPGVEVIDLSALRKLLEVERKEIKKELLDGFEPEDFHRDVWVLTAKDEGTVIEGSRSDLFVLKLAEHSSAGYVWNFDELNEAGFAIVRDEREGPEGGFVGGIVTRSITACSEEPQSGCLSLSERRPWLQDAQPNGSFTLRYNLQGPEIDGLSLAERRLTLEAA